MPKHIEKAVVDCAGRIKNAVKSQYNYYNYQRDYLNRVRRACQQQLARGAENRDEYTDEIEKCDTEIKKLESGWAHSSLRRALNRVGTDNGSKIETRSAVSSSPVTSTPARTTGTTSRAANTSSRLTAASLQGYAAVFDKLSQDLGYFREKIRPGAFSDALAKSDIRFLFNHDPNYIYGRNTAATLELREDNIGLRFACYLLSFDAASYSLARRIDRRDVTQCSFSFIVVKDSWDFNAGPNGSDIRTIEKIDRIFDISAVTYPAYLDTSITAKFEKSPSRSAQQRHDEAEDNESDFEAYFQENPIRLIDDQQMREKRIAYRAAGRILNRYDLWTSDYLGLS